jgi:hypothetical protein
MFLRGDVHTQGIANFWRVLQTSDRLTSFRFNNRESQEIFNMVVANLLIGTTLRYKALTAKTSHEPVLLSSSEPE